MGEGFHRRKVGGQGSPIGGCTLPKQYSQALGVKRPVFLDI